MTQEQFNEAFRMQEKISDLNYMIDNMHTSRIGSVLLENGEKIKHLPRGFIKDAVIKKCMEDRDELLERFKKL